MATKKTAPKKQENVKEVAVLVTEKTKVVARISEYEGINRIDIRKHIVSAKFTGFTKEGVNLTVEKARELYEALGKLLATVEAEGLWNEADEAEVE
jgi:uncharacterized protein YpmB